MNVFEKFREEESASWVSKDVPPILTIRAFENGKPDDYVLLHLGDGRGHDVLAITADGQMHFAPGYTPTQQAEAFRQAINMLSQRAVFPLAPPPVLASGPFAIGECVPDATPSGGIPNPAPRLSDPEPGTPKTFPQREDVPHPGKLL
jgi:hypothetical protein